MLEQTKDDILTKPTYIRFRKNGQIVRMHGDLHHVLQFPQGIPEFNFFTLLHSDLQNIVRTQFEQLVKNQISGQVFQAENHTITLQQLSYDEYEIHFEFRQKKLPNGMLPFYN